MLHRILKKLKIIKLGPEQLSLESNSLKENPDIWSYLEENSTQIGGQLEKIIKGTQDGQSFRLDLAGGTITIPSGLECDLNLYNHFKEYFKVDYKIPMFLYHTVGTKNSYLETAILDNYEVFRKTFKGTRQPQSVAYFTMGPEISWGRHSRWRAQFDIYKTNKTTAVTNHACHDWSKVDNIYCDLGKTNAGSKIIVVSGKADTNTLNAIPVVKGAKQFKQAKRQFTLNNGNSYNFIENKHGLLSGNHIVMSPRKSKCLKPEEFDELQNFKKDGIIYNAYVLPKDTSEIEFGIWWPIKEISVQLHYTAGEHTVHTIQLDATNSVLYRAEVTKAASELVMWQKYPDTREESYSLAQPMLVVRNKASGDCDFTEFQSCWRNQGFESNIYPHWLGNFKAMKPSSRLTGVVNFNFFERGHLVLQALRPKGCGDISGTAEVNIFNRSGRQMDKKEIIVRDTKSLHFDFNTETYGTDIAALRIRSENIDFTANLVQWNTSGATSIQHLWGY